MSRNSFPWVEKFLESDNLKLKGIPDLVKSASSGLEIIDYKTGYIKDLKSFAIQMHIYLMLVNEISCQKVKILKIRDFSLQEKEIPIDKSIISQIQNFYQLL